MDREDWVLALAVKVAAVICREYEGLELKPYLCPALVATIGYGATHYLDGRKVTLKDPPITKEQAEALLIAMLYEDYLPQVLALCPNVTDPYRLAALIDFCFNLGSGNLRASTLRRKVNADDWKGAIVEFMRWVKAAGRVLAGLVRRRKAEVALIGDPD